MLNGPSVQIKKDIWLKKILKQQFLQLSFSNLFVNCSLWINHITDEMLEFISTSWCFI